MATVQAAEERCPRFSRLLDRARASLVVLVPNNAAFEEFLNLPPGALEGQDIDFIVAALPGYLTRVNLNIRDLCRLLRRHISKSEAKTVDELLERGFITMINGDEQPVAIGRGGVTVAYQAPITERDVFTVNGVIQYLVIVEVPEEETEPPPDDDDDDPDNPIDLWCSRDLCEDNEALYNECVDFMRFCLLEAGNTPNDREKCAAAGLFMCSELDLF